MSNIHLLPSFAAYLASDDLSLEGLKELLRPDFSCADKGNVEHECPLVFVLKNEKCSIDIVKHLLQFNSSINCRDMRGNPCLVTALVSSQDEAIIKLLLENGAAVYSSDVLINSFPCISIQIGASTNIIKLLLDATPAPNECRYHGPLINCVLGSRMELTEDFLNLLLSAGTNLKSVDPSGFSPLCVALQTGAPFRVIELLLSKGSPVNACQVHNSPMLCATDLRFGSRLKADVVQLLLNKNAAMDKNDIFGTPLQYALSRTNYEMKAIKLMVDHPSFDANALLDENKGNLLHLAVGNPCCKLSAVKLLIERGVQVDKENKRGQTPLEQALLSDQTRRNTGIIQVLLKNGCPAERFPETSLTPLRLAVTRHLHCWVLKLLFAAGASIELLRKYGQVSLLHYALQDYTANPKTMKLDRVKLLLKFSILENQDFNIQCLRMDLSGHSEVNIFADQCRIEMQKLDLYNLGNNHSLLDFAKHHRFPMIPTSVINYDLNQLLRILSGNAFPVFFDIISAKVGRETMETKLEEVSVYAFHKKTSSSSTNRSIVLNDQCVCAITKYLSDENVMNLIIAYYAIN